MSHCITAIILKGDLSKEAVERYDLRGLELGPGLHLFFIDHYYSAVWQHRLGLEGFLEANADYALFPKERVLARIAREVTQNEECVFAIVATDYFGGTGKQWAQVYRGDTSARPCCSINKALQKLGVERSRAKDEFETVGLDKIRSQPEHLESYEDLADELGV